MSNLQSRRAFLISAVAIVAAAACGSDDPLSSSPPPDAGSTLVVGSQAYYSNEIIAEIYAQALESNGFKVDREFQIGQREVYLPELRSGKIDVFPEYIGSLLQAFDPEAAAGATQEVYAQLQQAIPSGLTVLTPSAASDQNSWTVTRKFAELYGLTDLASLKNVTVPITVGGNSELETRPYGPAALEDRYGIAVAGFTAVEDSGGPLTVKALVDGDIQLANIYTADPTIKSNDLVALSDPDGLFFPDNVAPVVSDRVTAEARAVLEAVSSALTQADFVALNAQSVIDKESAAGIAGKWLATNPITMGN
jgi:osmoprotectant transport system substrate-binding protein